MERYIEFLEGLKYAITDQTANDTIDNITKKLKKYEKLDAELQNMARFIIYWCKDTHSCSRCSNHDRCDAIFSGAKDCPCDYDEDDIIEKFSGIEVSC